MNFNEIYQKGDIFLQEFSAYSSTGISEIEIITNNKYKFIIGIGMLNSGWNYLRNLIGLKQDNAWILKPTAKAIFYRNPICSFDKSIIPINAKAAGQSVKIYIESPESQEDATMCLVLSNTPNSIPVFLNTIPFYIPDNTPILKKQITFDRIVEKIKSFSIIPIHISSGTVGKGSFSLRDDNSYFYENIVTALFPACLSAAPLDKLLKSEIHFRNIFFDYISSDLDPISLLFTYEYEQLRPMPVNQSLKK
jgi:hypothetical protein